MDCAATGSNDGDTLSGEVHVVPPLGGVERRALEGLEALDPWQLGNRELSAGDDQHVGLMITSACLDQPRVTGLLPVRADHLGTSTDLVEYAEVSGDTLEVGLDLGLRRVPARPPWVRGEGELVKMGRYVACRPGIGVVVPDSADALAALEDCDVLVSGPAQHDSCTDAAEAAANNRH